MILRERLHELADGSAEIGAQFAAEGEDAARDTLAGVEQSLRGLAEAFVPPPRSSSSD
jgi:hypothetical protein